MNIKQILGGTVALLAMAGAANAQTVNTVDVKGLKQAIAANKGKVTVVNFWATWCGPCVAEFPDLVKVYKANKTKGLELVTVSCDDKGDSAKVKAFLSKNGLTKGWQNSLGQDITADLQYLEPKTPLDNIGIPRTYIIDRKGKIVKSFVGGLDQAAFQKAIDPYLKAK